MPDSVKPMTDTTMSLRRPARLLAPVAPREWDALLRGAGLVALAGIAVSALWPAAAELAALFALGLFCNGPYSPVLPATVEPLVMIYGQVYPPSLVAAIATLSAVLAEIVDLRLYGAALASRRLAAARDTRLSRWMVDRFARAPFLATVVAAATPIPFWLARCCAVVAGYPARRFLLATALGRWPRWLLYAMLGSALKVGAGWLIGAAALLTVAFLLPAAWRRR